MEQQLKQRLVGAAVLLGLAVLFIPMVLNNSDEPKSALEKVAIPERPSGFSSRVVPLEEPVPDPPASDKEPALSEPAVGETESPTPVEESVDQGTSEKTQPTESEVREGIAAWVVQLGSFTSEENARSLEQRLLKKGYAAFVEGLEDKDKKVYRVRIGPEILKSSATKLVVKLEKETRLKGIVVRYP